jgi:hypothetical protein
MAKCRSCGAEIRWIETTAGKHMPCNPLGVRYWAQEKAKGKVITPNGEVLSCVFEGDERQATGIGYVPHWSTCKSANQHRKKEVQDAD